jgi:histidyl-tRNA synthetase
MTQFKALKGFRDLYPKEKSIQSYIFQKMRETASLFGYEEYDGPVIEPINLYLEKSSKELVENQTFQVVSKKEEALVMRPEMTPTLARMVASMENQLIFPLKLVNIGLRYRYEAPQKGREREFYQADFDILGNNLSLSDAEIIATAVNLFVSFGAKKEDFVVYINSRSEMEKNLIGLGFKKEDYKALLDVIDKQDKISNEKFIEMLRIIETDQNKIDNLISFLNSAKSEDSEYFKTLFLQLADLGVSQYCKVNYNITRGLDYYTGLVFEVKEKGEMKRSLLGGGRYDNLVTYFGGKNNIQGVGFATSDVVLWAFLKDKNLLPEICPKKTKILVTVFSPEMETDALEMTSYLRKLNIPAETFLDSTKKLDKQIKYADRNGIPFVLIMGPE